MMRFGMLLLAALSAACSSVRTMEPTNTGYTGTWMVGNDRARSTIAIAYGPGGYHFRWNKVSYLPDGRIALRVDCDWDGTCVETIHVRCDDKTGECREIAEPVVSATFRYERPFVDEATGELVVACTETRTEPDRFERRIVDAWVVEPGGTTLSRYTREREGQVFEGAGRPHMAFRKVANGVADPPGTTR